eukprot:831189-Pleurochrysis_carterae.AAC.1
MTVLLEHHKIHRVDHADEGPPHANEAVLKKDEYISILLQLRRLLQAVKEQAVKKRLCRPNYE